MAAQIAIEDKPGRRIYRNLINSTKYASELEAIQVEFCHYLFGEMADSLLKTRGIKIMMACMDSETRKSLSVPDSQLHRQKNSREFKILIKSGFTDFYLSKIVANLIHNNPVVQSAISTFYENKPVYVKRSMDQLIIKPKFSEDSYAMLDCDITTNLQPIGSMENPFHYVNIFCINAPRYEFFSDSSRSGGISILENFEKYFSLFQEEFRKGVNFVLEKQPLHNKGKTQFKDLDLRKFNSYIEQIHGKMAPKLKWINLDLQSGDMAVIDCRIPYKYHRNQQDTPAVYTNVSLEPDSINHGKNLNIHPLVVQAQTTGKVGNWNSSTYKETNFDEYVWRSSRIDQYSL